MPNIYRCRELLIKYKPPLIFTYEPTTWQIDILLTLFPWLKGFTILICKNPTKFESLFVPANLDEPHIDIDFFNFLRQLTPQTNIQVNQKIYVTRNDATTRRMLNESVLLDKLEVFGYKAFDMSKISFFEEMALFRSAKYVIYISGSHCMNTIFCPPSTPVCTIQSFKSVLSTKFLLNNFGVNNIEYQIPPENGKHLGHNDDFKIEVTDFLRFLKENRFI